MSQQQMNGQYDPQHAARRPQGRRNPSTRHRMLRAVGAVVAVAAIGGALGACDAEGSDGSKDTASTSTGGSGGKDGGDGKKDDGKKKEDKPEVAIKGDGDFEVGSDVKPGTYRTTGNDDGMCYWERLNDSADELEAIIANDNVTGTSYVTIKSGDKLFKSESCKGWTAVDENAKGAPKATEIAGDGGMFKVGVDIAPGTYKSAGNEDDLCYWERAKDAEHGIDSIAANDNVNGTGVVTVTADDAYFKTSGCKDWKKTG
ncbi:hypothetical protein [Streptomyces sp. KLOTTS4A1]|uniref:hypothetical protein n=1 Tax=Streptomyces sp. KLOTTS4A1 TaxID=3390996 RepID=UPI0039F5A5B8